ncbi:twin-arginine translocase TatA/TatE family subunit [Metabacillus dongyingensis]|uniref:twin-arginine translocase TatA/TatE family subunit n=1 Tax=Metabacillus dongyingensis TaxID=2874282 RepID=UPI003B8D67CA
MVGPGSIVLIGAIALIIFGPKKLPELGRAVGTTLKEFKQSTKGIMDDGKDDEKDNVKDN